MYKTHIYGYHTIPVQVIIQLIWIKEMNDRNQSISCGHTDV